MIIAATPVLPGEAVGRVLKLDEPLSFWGGIDPKTGRITDPTSPHVGRSVAGTVLVMPGTRGSSSGSAVMLQLLHAGLAPAAIILGDIDAIVGLGILVAGEMGWPTIPLLLLEAQDQAALVDGLVVTLAADGTVESHAEAGAGGTRITAVPAIRS